MYNVLTKQMQFTLIRSITRQTPYATCNHISHCEVGASTCDGGVGEVRSSGIEQRSISSFRLAVSWESCGEDDTTLYKRVVRLTVTHWDDCLILSDWWGIQKSISLNMVNRHMKYVSKRRRHVIIKGIMCKVSICNLTKLEAIQSRHHMQHATTFDSVKLKQASGIVVCGNWDHQLQSYVYCLQLLTLHPLERWNA